MYLAKLLSHMGIFLRNFLCLRRMEPEELERISPDVRSSCVAQRPAGWEEATLDLSILVPTHNDAAHICRAVDSCREQETEYSFEIIIVNDGSTDDTAQLLKRYEALPNVTVVHQENMGRSGARNTALSVCRGAYILFHDSDDTLLPGAVQSLLSAAFARDAQVVAGGLLLEDSNGVRRPGLSYTEGETAPSAVSGMTCGKVYHRSLFQNLQFPLGYWYEDSIISQILLPTANRCWCIDRPVFAYLSNAAGITATSQGTPKSLDSLYITAALLSERAHFGLRCNLDSYRYFLHMVILTYQRTKRLGPEVAYGVFQAQRRLKHRYYPDIQMHTPLERALQEEHYRAYVWQCELGWFRQRDDGHGRKRDRIGKQRVSAGSSKAWTKLLSRAGIFCRNYLFVRPMEPEELERIQPDGKGSCMVQRPAYWEAATVDLSILVPTYNDAAHICRAVDSCLEQETEYSFEIIIVNDGSTDNTAQLLKQYAASPNVTVIHQENAGHSGARNAALAVCHGRYLLFQDSDDTLLPGAVQALLSCAFGQGADVVAGGHLLETPEGVRSPGRHFAAQECPLTEIPGFPWGKVYRRGLFSNLQFPDGYWFEDSVVSQILLPMAGRVRCIPQEVSAYLCNANGISAKSQGMPKTLDSLYITATLLAERARFGLRYDSESYRHFLHMVVLTYQRTKELGPEVAYGVFQAQRRLKTRYYPDFQEHTPLEKALEEDNYRAYVRRCELSWLRR